MKKFKFSYKPVMVRRTVKNQFSIKRRGEDHIDIDVINDSQLQRTIVHYTFIREHGHTKTRFFFKYLYKKVSRY